MGDTLRLAVNGTLMRGLQLHNNLIEAKAVFLKVARTEAAYRLYSIDDIHPAMVRTIAGGASVEVEVYEISPDGMAQVLVKEPQGLCVGKVRLEDGEEVLGVLGEPVLCENKREITEYGGWHNYMAALEPKR